MRFTLLFLITLALLPFLADSKTLDDFEEGVDSELPFMAEPIHHLSIEIFQFSKFQDPLIVIETPTLGQRRYCAYDVSGKANSIKAGQKNIWTLWEGHYCQGNVIAKGVGQTKSINKGGPVRFKSISVEYGGGSEFETNAKSKKSKRVSDETIIE